MGHNSWPIHEKWGSHASQDPTREEERWWSKLRGPLNRQKTPPSWMTSIISGMWVGKWTNRLEVQLSAIAWMNADIVARKVMTFKLFKKRTRETVGPGQPMKLQRIKGSVYLWYTRHELNSRKIHEAIRLRRVTLTWNLNPPAGLTANWLVRRERGYFETA